MFLSLQLYIKCLLIIIFEKDCRSLADIIIIKSMDCLDILKDIGGVFYASSSSKGYLMTFKYIFVQWNAELLMYVFVLRNLMYANNIRTLFFFLCMFKCFLII